MKKYFISGVMGLLGIATSGKADTLYWWPGAVQGGPGAWNTTASSWSTSGESKIGAAAVPGSGDTAIFAGSAGAISYVSGQSVKDFRVETGGYVFTLSAGTPTLAVEEFSGAGLAGTTIRAQGVSAVTNTFALTVTGTTSFSGTFANGVAGSALGLRKSGAGLLDLSSATLVQTGPTQVQEGILRAKEGTGTAGSLPTTQSLQLGTSGGTGILEVVGNGVSSSFSRTVTATTGTANGFLLGSAATSVVGFGAVQGNLTVNLNNNASNKDWGGSGFLAGTLVLGTKTSTGKVTLVNPLTLVVGGPSVAKIQVVHGGTSAQKVDAELQGALQISGTDSGGGAIANRVLEKNGNGTLVLSGTSSAFNGRLRVSEGTLLINAAFVSNTNNTNALQVDAGAILGGSGTVAFTNASARIEVAGALQAGFGAANTNFADDYDFTTLTINQSHVVMGENSILAFGLGATSDLRDVIATTGGGIWEFDATQRVKFYDAGLATVGTTYAIMTGLSADPLPGAWQIYDSGNIDGTFSYAGGVVSFTISQIPEPQIATLMFAAGAWLILPKRRRAKA